jgi:hypothetical protein
VEKYGRATYATDDNIIRHMHIASWITKATNTRSEYVILLCHNSSGYAHVPVLHYIDIAFTIHHVIMMIKTVFIIVH